MITLLLGHSLIYLSNSVVVPMLTTIAKDMNVAVSIAGIVSTISMLVTGITLLCSNILQKAMQPQWIVSAAILLNITSNFIISQTNHFTVLLICRAFVGVSLGMVSFSTITLITTWLSPVKRGYYLTAQTAINTMCVFLASRVTVPLMQMLERGWKGIFSLMAILGTASLAMWLPSVQKQSPHQPVQTTAPSQINKKGFLWMIKRKDLLMLCLFLALVSCAHIAVTTYLAAYLEVFRGLSVAKAATYFGYISLSGMFGGPLASLLSTKLGKRKPVLLFGVAGAMVSLLLIINITSELVLAVVVLIYGFFGIAYQPITQIITTELRDITPELASMAYSISFSTAYLSTLFTPLIMTTALKFMSMQAAMYVFIGIYFLTCVSALFIEETGIKAKLGKR